jgi:hypothetical protein
LNEAASTRPIGQCLVTECPNAHVALIAALAFDDDRDLEEI